MENVCIWLALQDRIISIGVYYPRRASCIIISDYSIELQFIKNWARWIRIYSQFIVIQQ
jgi:hypothetical protein